MASVTIREEPTGPEAPAQGAPVDNSPQRPDWVPEKFWDAEKGETNYEALAKSYSELERKLGSRQQDEPQNPEEPNAQPTDEQVSNILIEKGLNPDRFTREFETMGGLSDESYEELEAAGFPRAMVDQYLAGANAAQAIEEAGRVLGERDINEVMELVGGSDNFDSLAQWAARSVPPEDLEVYNDMVNSGNKAQAKAAVTWLKTMYEDANGAEGNLYGGEGFGGPAVEPFRSSAQVVEAMRDKRYKIDPSYREEVARRLAASSIF